MYNQSLRTRFFSVESQIADFGFSALFESTMEETMTSSEGGGIPIRRLKSVVGSPFYVAPEVISIMEASLKSPEPLTN